MKQITIGLFLLVLLSGCSSKEVYDIYIASHDKSTTDYYNAAQSMPLVDIELPSPVADKPYKIVVNQQLEIITTRQIKNSEWTGVVGALVGGLMGLGNTYVNQHYETEKVKSYMAAGTGMLVQTNGGDFNGSDMMKTTEMSTIVGGDGGASLDLSRREMMEPESEPESEPEPEGE